jgi:putative membrane protein
MSSTITLAFLHHAAAFLLVAVAMVELVLMRGDLTLGSARSLVRMDAVYGIAAAVILIVGFLRVFYTEKGSAYYFHSGTFLAKFALFVIVALLSIYPTMQFMGWRKVLAAQRVPTLDAATRRRIRLILHVELSCCFS